jgi:hypothetical protein
METVNAEPEQLIIRWASEIEPRPPRQWPPADIDHRPGAICQTCGTKHRSWHAVASCRWRRACWIITNGNLDPGKPCYATLSFCGGPGQMTCMLWSDLSEAESGMRIIAKSGCGGRCTRQHRLIAMGVDGETT